MLFLHSFSYKRCRVLTVYFDTCSGKLEAKTTVGKPRGRREGNIKMVPKEIVCECVDCIRLALDTVP